MPDKLPNIRYYIRLRLTRDGRGTPPPWLHSVLDRQFVLHIYLIWFNKHAVIQSHHPPPPPFMVQFDKLDSASLSLSHSPTPSPCMQIPRFGSSCLSCYSLLTRGTKTFVPICIFQIKLLQDVMEIGQHQQLEMERESGEVEERRASIECRWISPSKQNKMREKAKKIFFIWSEITISELRSMGRGQGRNRSMWLGVKIELTFYINQEYILYRYNDRNLCLQFN